jgi:RNA-splicing ligase RtcB
MTRLERLDATRWRIPRHGGMRVDGIVYASEAMIADLRQVMTHWMRQSFAETLGRPAGDLGLDVVYDVCHNIAKLETFAALGGCTRRDVSDVVDVVDRAGIARKVAQLRPLAVVKG